LKKKTKQSKSYTNSICPLCGKKGHLTKKSKNCLFNPTNPDFDATRQQTMVTASLLTTDPINSANEIHNNDAEDVDDYDQMLFTDDIPMPEQQDKLFYDTGTWSEGEDGVIHVTAPL
jgi:hypothetical protein